MKNQLLPDEALTNEIIAHLCGSKILNDQPFAIMAMLWGRGRVVSFAPG
jgi:hypothetical protein